jgi:DNA-binding MarR family transcriptional regulator
LRPKIFESELVTKGREYFHNKIMVHSDLIVAFEGMSTKQRQQLVNFFTALLEGSYSRDRNALSNVSTLALFGLASEQLDRFREELMSTTFLDRVPPFRHNVTREMKKKILQFRAKLQQKEESFGPPTIKLPLPEKIDDAKKVHVVFPRSKEIDNRIVEYALELDSYHVQSFARAQDYIKVFMRCNALLNGRRNVTISDLYLYDLVHPLFLGSMGELGTENLVLSLFKRHPDLPDKELIEKSNLSRGTFYRYKKILLEKGLV